MPKYLLAHDLGTSGNKGTLFTTDGQLVKSVTIGYDVHFFNNNWAEQDAQSWWSAFCAANEALVQGIDRADILAVSFSGQMMGCLPVDRNGEPLRPAIIWADMRADKEEKHLASRIDPQRFYRMVGHRISSSYGIEKLMWIKNNEPDVYRRTHKVFNAKDYIVHKLTGQFLTDYSDASGFNAFDLNTFAWSPEILDCAGIDVELLPEAKESAYVAGEIGARVSAECHLAPGTKVVLGGGDGCCASVGALSVEPGVTYNCLGSSSWICTTSKEPVFDEKMRIFNWAHVVPGMIAPCGTMQTAGAAFSWIKNNLCEYESHLAGEKGGSPYDIINREIASSPVGANGILFLPYLLGERSPRWNSDAKGAFIGLRMENSKSDMLRSVVEGIAMNLAIILDILKTEVDIREMMVVGGLAQGAVQRQIFADVYGMPVVKPVHIEEASSIGAAVVAGVGVGALGDYGAARTFNPVDSRDNPIPGNVSAYNGIKPVFDKAYWALYDIFPML